MKLIYRGEVWLVNLDPTVGTEISKKRPCIIVNDNAIGILPLKVVVPVTDWKERYSIRPWMVKLEPTTENSLAKVSSVDTFQIRSVSVFNEPRRHEEREGRREERAIAPPPTSQTAN